MQTNTKDTKNNVTNVNADLLNSFLDDQFFISCCENYKYYPDYPDLIENELGDVFFERMVKYIDANLYDPKNVNGKFASKIRKARQKNNKIISDIKNIFSPNSKDTKNNSDNYDSNISFYENIKKKTGTENAFDLLLFAANNKELIQDEIKEKINKIKEESIIKYAPDQTNNTTTNDTSTTNTNTVVIDEDNIVEVLDDIEETDNIDETKNESQLAESIFNSIPTKKNLTKKRAKKYISDNFADIMLKYVDPEYKTIVHKCRTDITRIIKGVLNDKIIEKYMSTLVDITNKLLNTIYDSETDKLVEYIDRLNVTNKGEALNEEGKKILTSMINTIKNGKNKDVTKVIDLIMSQIGEFGIFNNVIYTCIKHSGRFFNISNPVLYENITDDQILQFINTTSEHLIDKINSSDNDIEFANNIKLEIDKAVEGLNNIIDSINNNSLIEGSTDNPIITNDNINIQNSNQNTNNKKHDNIVAFSESYFNHEIMAQPLSSEIPIGATSIQEENIDKISYNNLPSRRKNDIKYIKNTIYRILDQNIWTKQFKVYALKDNMYAIELKKRNDTRPCIYKIDAGTVIGHGKYLVIDSHYLSLEELDILKKVFDNPNESLVLSEDEKNIINSYLFTNKDVYNYIDMHYEDENGNMSIMDISNEDYLELGNTLSKILKFAKKKSKSFNYRFRFEKFNSIDSFTLVSDQNVKNITKVDIQVAPKEAKVVYNKFDSNGKENRLITIYYNNKKYSYNL